MLTKYVRLPLGGILDGVTTNPSLIKKSGRDFKTVVAEIASICDGPISAEVTALDLSLIHI